jgi:hypothetical protein
MLERSAIGCVVLASALWIAIGGAAAFDESKYPDLKGQWQRTTAPRWAKASEAPLTEEYRAIFEANLREQAQGRQGTDPTYTCLSPGMPRVMNVYEPMEIVVTPWTTHLLMQHIHDARRIFTDGRDWPADETLEPTFAGYSIGQWFDEDGDGRYDTLLVETRNIKGPRSYDSSGLPLHRDNQTVIKERIHLEKADPDTLYDDITVIDHALTRPWTITKKYVRSKEQHPVWRESVCAENNRHIVIGTENYFLSGDGNLMPVRKDQPPPDLRYFNSRK